MDRKYLCNINEDESLHLQDNNQFVVHTLDINAPQEWFDVVVLKQEGYDKMKKQISELQEKLSDAQDDAKQWGDMLDKAQDKLHRRNLQIADLKKKSLSRFGEIVLSISDFKRMTEQIEKGVRYTNNDSDCGIFKVEIVGDSLHYTGEHRSVGTKSFNQ